ncbi:hypothetical protein BKA63DRAFT_492667 [Paraphoma chrysanthemicola]|nr:hypothetical protein BKA63DRAFT_492667 [Paraphoma chrysanthemicola]
MAKEAQKQENSFKPSQNITPKRTSRGNAVPGLDRGRIAKRAQQSEAIAELKKKVLHFGHTNANGREKAKDDDLEEDIQQEEDTITTAVKRKIGGGIFGRHVPPRNLRFSSFGNLTAAELLTFLPESIRSKDIVNRLVENGFTTDEISKVINYHRVSPKTHKAMNNTLLHATQKTMRDANFTNWTVGKHHMGLYSAQNRNWDAKNLNLDGMRPQCEYVKGHGNGEAPQDNVKFVTLAIGVQNFPSLATGDGLDLTRCVAFAVQNPHLDLKFPRDFEEITKHLGQGIVQDKHYDRNAAARWRRAPKPKDAQPPTPTKTTLVKKPVASSNSTQNRHHAMAKGTSKLLSALKPAPLPVQMKKTQVHSAMAQQQSTAQAMNQPVQRFSAHSFHNGAFSMYPQSLAPIQPVAARTVHAVNHGLTFAADCFDMPASIGRSTPSPANHGQGYQQKGPGVGHDGSLHSMSLPQPLSDLVNGRLSVLTEPFQQVVQPQDSSVPYWLTDEFDRYLAYLIAKADY